MKLAAEGRPLPRLASTWIPVSVGATVNITILAAVKAKGRTVIENAARNLRLSMW